MKSYALELDTGEKLTARKVKQQLLKEKVYQSGNRIFLSSQVKTCKKITQ